MNSYRVLEDPLPVLGGDEICDRSVVPQDPDALVSLVLSLQTQQEIFTPRLPIGDRGRADVVGVRVHDQLHVPGAPLALEMLVEHGQHAEGMGQATSLR